MKAETICWENNVQGILQQFCSIYLQNCESILRCCEEASKTKYLWVNYHSFYSMKQGKTNFLLMWSQFKNYTLDNASLQVIRQIWCVHSDQHSSQMTLQIKCATIIACNAHDSHNDCKPRFWCVMPEIYTSVTQSLLNWGYSSSKSKCFYQKCQFFWTMINFFTGK